jgi:PEP-CTERM putative exosortase interaction domain
MAVAVVMSAAVSQGVTLSWSVDVGDATDVDSAILVAVSNSDPATYYLSGAYGLPTGTIRTNLETAMEQYNPDTNPTVVTDAAYSGTTAGGNVDWSNYSFHVLLVDNSGNHLLSTEGIEGNSMTFSQLQSAGFTNGIGARVWAVTPEPSCALLFGLGAALVAIRRRRR